MELSAYKNNALLRPSLHKSRYVSMSSSDREYQMLTRSLPTTNPVKRGASPDLVSSPERINSTKNPFEEMGNRRPPSMNEDSGRIFELDPRDFDRMKSEILHLRRELAVKSADNERLSRLQLSSLQNMPSSPFSMKESEAKQVAKRFAEDRLRAENESRLWMSRYQALLSKVESLENGRASPSKSQQLPANSPVLELVNEIKAWEHTAAEIDKVNREIRSEAEFFRTRAEENEIGLHKFRKELELWKLKYQSFDEEVSRQIMEYEAKLVSLTKQVEFYEKEGSTRRGKDSRESEDRGRQEANKVWEQRCLDIESEWSGKFREVEIKLRKSLGNEEALNSKVHALAVELEAVMKKNEVYRRNIELGGSRIRELEELSEKMRVEGEKSRESESQLISEMEAFKIEGDRVGKELENARITEGELRKEIDRLREICRVGETKTEAAVKDLQDFMRKSQNSRELSDLAQRHRVEKDAYQSEVSALTSRIQQISSENASLQAALRSSEAKLSEYQEKIAVLSSKQIRPQIAASLDLCELRQILTETRELSQVQSDFQGERLAFETTISQLRSRVLELESSLQILIRDFEEHKRASSSLSGEREALRRKSGMLESQLANTVSGLRADNEELRKDVSELRAKLKYLSEEKSMLQAQLSQSSAELANALDQAKSLESQLAEARTSLIAMSSQRPAQIQQSEDNAETAVLRREIQGLKTDRDHYKSQSEARTREVVEKNLQFIDKIQELTEVKAKYQESILRIASLEEKLIMRLKEELMLV